jgi:ABC-type nitrate/sulfonate/bicarbonate transport system ATPase subunit
MAPRLSINIEGKRFGASEPLFSGFRLEIEPGSVVAILGPSGIGKSSLLRLIGGIDGQFFGHVLLDGRAARDAPPPGFVFQDARLLPWLTARENVRLADPAMTAQTADDLLAAVELGGRGDDFPAQLSGGMQRRVALARAMAARGGLLLLDEPFVSLDAMLAAEMRALLARVIVQTRPGIVLVTHDVEDAAQLADRVIVLAGRPAQIVGDLSLSVTGTNRDEAVLEEYRARISALLAMDRKPYQ